MLAGLRKMEDEAYDDDEEAMREMEMEDSGDTRPKPTAPKILMPEAEILVADSQPGFPLVVLTMKHNSIVMKRKSRILR